MDRERSRLAGIHVPARELGSAADRDQNSVFLDQCRRRSRGVHDRREQGRRAIRPACHGEHPHQLVVADRDQAISPSVEREGADLLRMAPDRIEKRSPAHIPNPRAVARDRQKPPVRTERQRLDWSGVPDLGEQLAVSQIPDLHLAGEETERDRGSIGAEPRRTDTRQLFRRGESLAVTPGPEVHKTVGEAQEQQVSLRLKIELL